MHAGMVSVVVPTYNRAYCLPQTIDSALRQTYSNFEIIVVDDGSTDDTLAVLRSRYAEEPRVIVISQANSGVSAARNAALRAARGNFIAFLDSDDIWKPWKLEVQLACLARIPEAGMIWTDFAAVDDTGKLLYPRYLRRGYPEYRLFSNNDLFTCSYTLSNLMERLPEGVDDGQVHCGEIFTPMISGNLVHTSTVLLRREWADRLGGFNEALQISGEDWDYHLRTCALGLVVLADVVSIDYRIGASDQLTRPTFMVHQARNALITLLPIIKKERARIHLSSLALRKVLAGKYKWLGMEQFELNQKQDCRRSLLRSLGYFPAQPRVAFWLLLSLFPQSLVDGLRGVYQKVKSFRPA